ncbi:MAG: hypothetical protein HYX92_06200 [Chloroflexi bacterium]|nr:hypothetical protein [Chloroflexota bacterium]
MAVQKRGIPTVTMVTSEFVPVARFHAKSRGFPDLPIVMVPHPFETLPHDVVKKLAEEKFDEIMGHILEASARPAA